MNRCLLGVDGGASKTRCVIADFNGTIIARGSGGCANKNVTSFETAIHEVRMAVMDALAKGGYLPANIISAHYGLGGLAAVDDHRLWISSLQDLTPNALISVVNDVFLAVPATDQDFGIAVVSGSGGNIGAITPSGNFHVNGRVNFHSAQLGLKALQALLLQIQIQKKLDPFGQALLEVANLDKEHLLELFHTQPEHLARELSPHVSKLLKQEYPQAREIVLTWLGQVYRDIQNFQRLNQLEFLPVCLAGSTFASLKTTILEHFKFPSGSFISDLPLEEGAVQMARKQAIADKAPRSHRP